MNKSFNLLSGGLLLRNVGWNLVGAVLPMAIALWAVPVLIRELGKERFGLLTIVWMGVGYFSLFDMGVGRALTKLVAERLGRGSRETLPNLIRLGLRLMLVLGLSAGVLVCISAPWLCRNVLKIPSTLMGEGIWSFRLLAASLPFVIASAGLTGVLQAYQRFAVINIVRVPLGLASYIGPVLVLPLSHSLVASTLVMLVVRALTWVILRHLCSEYLVGPKHSSSLLDKGEITALLSFGGWITVSNVVGPLMVYFDRFLVGCVLGMTSVAYYTTSYETITRVWFVPEAMMAVLFPAITTALATGGDAVRMLTAQAFRYLLMVMAVPIGLVLLFAPEGLQWWLGPEFAAHGTPVMRWLAVGVFINSFARLPFTLLQSAGRPDLTAKLHLAELPLYLGALYLLMRGYGITGTAVAWTGRIVFDTIILYLFAVRQVPSLKNVQLGCMAITAVVACGLACFAFAESAYVKLLLAGGVSLVCGIAFFQVLIVDRRRSLEAAA